MKEIRKKKRDTIEKWAKALNKHFSTDEIQLANKHLKRRSTSLVIREMQIYNTVKYCYIYLPNRMVIMKKTDDTK